MDSSGKSEGILVCPSKGTMGSMAGTSVRSSMVVGRRRCVGASGAGGRAPIGTRKREIMLPYFLARLMLLVGRAPRAPGCFPSLAQLRPALLALRPRLWAAPCAFGQH